jgi:hypothetical protein
MAVQSATTLKTYFNTGDTPTEAQFVDLIDSSLEQWLSGGVLQADYTLTSSTSSQKLFNWSTNGALTLPTGLYTFEFSLYLTDMSATSGNGQIDIKGAGTATVARPVWHALSRDNSVMASAGSGSYSLQDTVASGTNAASSGTSTGLGLLGLGTFDITGAGTMIPSIALTTAAAAVVKAGSYLIVRRLGDTGTAIFGGTWS